MQPTPDIDGFVEAQDRLRSALGAPVDFEVYVEPVWPVGTQVDPETGKPFDPTVKATSGDEWTTITLDRVNVIRPAVDSEDEAKSTISGARRTGTCALDVAAADYPEIEQAQRFTVDGVRYNITEDTPDGIAERHDRRIIYGEAR